MNRSMNVRAVRSPALHRSWIAACAVSVVLLGLARDPQASWAGSSERTGTSGANELRIEVGPRSTALGGTTVADVAGAEALFWNPAGLAGLGGTQAYFTHVNYIADMKLNYFAIATRAGDFGEIGFSAKVLGVGDILVTTEQAPDGTGDVLSPTFTTLGLTYARRFTDRVRFGATGQVISEKVGQVGASGVGFDFGFQYDTGYRGLTFGVCMKNFGPAMSFNGPGFELGLPIPDAEPGSPNRTLQAASSSFELPSYFQLGAAYNLYAENQNQLRLLGSFTNNNFVPDELRGGAEYSYRDVFALRAGYGQRVSNSNDDLYSGLSFGAGLKVPLGGSNLHFDYSNRVVSKFFDDTQEFAVRLGF